MDGAAWFSDNKLQMLQLQMSFIKTKIRTAYKETPQYWQKEISLTVRGLTEKFLAFMI